MHEQSEYKVKVSDFEGPLELLLELIEKRKLHINDVSLAAVTDDFVSYIHALESLPLMQSAQFIWVASTLLLIKSKSLLPTLALTEEETEDIETLEYRLTLYQYFKNITPVIARQYGAHVLFARNAASHTEPLFAPDSSCSVPVMYAHICSVIKNLPKKERMKEAVVEKAMSLEEMIEQLSSRITQKLSLSFKEFASQGNAKDRKERVHVIVGFLAMLELVKRGVLSVEQHARFADITMKTETVHVPRYTK